MREIDPRIQSIEIEGRKIEFIRPDFEMAYTILAPLVAEAWAFSECGRFGDSAKALKNAMAVIEMASATLMALEVERQEPKEEPKQEPKTGPPITRPATSENIFRTQ